MFKNTNKLIAETYNVHQKLFKNTKSYGEQKKIIHHERKRLKISDDTPDFIIKLNKIHSGQNLVNLVKQGKLKVVCAVNNREEITLYITNNKAKVRAKVLPGQFIVPLDPGYQYLISSKEYEWQIPIGTTKETIKSFCFDQELKSPENLQYKIGEVVSGFFTDDMGQHQVWQIKIRMQEAAENFENNKHAIGLHKTQTLELFAEHMRALKQIEDEWLFFFIHYTQHYQIFF